jgi:hypothetical protein
MMISPLQGQFQLWFAKALGAKRSMFHFPENLSTNPSFEVWGLNLFWLFMLAVGFFFCCYIRKGRNNEAWALSFSFENALVPSSFCPIRHHFSPFFFALLCSLPVIHTHRTNSVLVLEIGTYIGFSTLGWASAVGPEGHVTALEFSAEYAKIAEETFAKNDVTNTEVVVGDARESSVDRA